MAPLARVIDYGAFPQPPSALFRDYVTGTPKTAPFFADSGRWDLDTIAAAAERSAARTLPRDAVADALAARQTEPRALEAARRLARPDAVAVVTGQQPVLFGGPLFVLYKALATVEIARRLEQKRRAPVVPVFWVAADDHDFAEIRSVSVPEDSGGLRTLRYTPRVEPSGEPAAAIVFDESLTSTLAELRSSLPSGEWRDATLGRIEAAYRPGATIVQAFARFLSAVVPELVVLDASDPALKRLMTPVFERELQSSSLTSRTVDEVGRDLLSAGYHQQVPVRAGLLNLFLVSNGVRRPLGITDGMVEVRGEERRLSLAEAVRQLGSDPAAWSAGALLRPLAQDMLLPTAAYVGGPAEIAYHAQIGRCYEAFGLARPVVVPRPGVTLVDAARARVLESEGLDLPDLQGDADGLIGRWVRQAYPEVETGFTRVRAAVAHEMGELARALAAHDPTLEGASHAATGRMLHPLESLQEKSMRALKKRDQARAERLRRTHDMLFPGGSFQERGLGFVGLLPRYGDGLLQRLRESVDCWARGHQVVTL